MKHILLAQLEQVEHIAKRSKLGRLFYHPFRYLFAILYRQFIYPLRKKIVLTEINLFFGTRMKIALPAATDIYLTGGKSHASEIRLAKFMIQHIQDGNQFLDIGAHYGYFTLLASKLVGEQGSVHSFEPTTVSFKILSHNCSHHKNITILQQAVSNQKEDLIFYEFPNLHSEYNSFDISQFKNEAWFEYSKPIAVKIAATTINDIISNSNFKPDFIKVDVEGGEYKVIEGGKAYLEKYKPILMMEYLAPHRTNEPHVKALEILQKLNYHPHIIQHDGQLIGIDNIDAYLNEANLESDNIVFVKH